VCSATPPARLQAPRSPPRDQTRQPVTVSDSSAGGLVASLAPLR
jgi:hypothetical protein